MPKRREEQAFPGDIGPHRNLAGLTKFEWFVGMAMAGGASYPVSHAEDTRVKLETREAILKEQGL